MPLTSDVLNITHAVAKNKDWFGDGGKPYPYGQADWLLEQLKWYFPTENFTHKKISNGSIQNGFDIEKFLSFASASSAFGENWDHHGDKFISFLKGWVAEAIFRKQIKCLREEIPSQFRQFIELAKHESLILTFNWDTIVESLFDKSSINYSYDLGHNTLVKKYVPIIKFHGSIDWFTNIDQWGHKHWMNFEPVSDNLEGFFRARGYLPDYYDSHIKPMLILPSYDKVAQVLALGNLWKYPWMFLQDRLEVIVVGFSMRQDDYHTRAVIYPQLVAGSRNKELKIKVVD